VIGRWVAVLALSVAPVFAVEGETNADPNLPVHAGTERVEVTGHGRDAGEAPTSFVTIIRPEDFSGRVVTLADLLGETPGVHVRQYGGLNGFATAMIRGSSAAQTIVCVDGVPLNSPLGGAVNLADVPLAGLDSIEIHRGFAPASLGASSIGGVVNIRTRRPGEGDGASGAISSGSFDTRTLSALGDWGTGPVRWGGSAEVTATAGDFRFRDNNGTEVTTADDADRDRVNNESWSAAMRVRGEVPLASGETLSISTEWLRRRQGVPGIDAYQSPHATFALQRGLVRVETTTPESASARWSLTTALDHEYTSQSFADPVAGITSSPQGLATRIEGTGASLRLVGRPSPAHRLSFLLEPRAQGAEQIDHVHPVDPIHARRAALDLVAEDEIHLASGRVLLAPSLRYDLIADRGRGGQPGTGGGPSGDLSAVSGRLGGLVALTPHWSVRGNIGRFYRAPDLIERYGSEGSIAGNPALLPERGINGDLGLSLSGGRLGGLDRITLELSAFRTDADDLIQLVSLPNRTLKAFNIGRARIAGLEASASFRLASRLTASANYTRQRPIDLSDTFASGGDLPGRPRVEANTSETLKLGRVALFHRFSYVGGNGIGVVAGVTASLPSGRAALTRLPARYLHDAGLRLRFGRRTEGSIEMDNLFDRRVVDVARYPLPGRTLFVKVATAL